MKHWLVILVAGFVGLSGCGEDDPDPGEGDTFEGGGVTPEPLAFGACNLLTETCVLPFPSSVFEKPDSSSLTGRVLSFSEEADFGDFWAIVGQVPHDGFSPIGPIITQLPGGFTPDSLPLGYDASLASDASIALVSADPEADSYGQRWPFDAEVVVSEEEPGVSILVLTPTVRLETNRRYVVVITDQVKDVEGNPHQPSETMQTLLSDEPASDELESLRLYYAPLRDLATDALGLSTDSIVQMWDFHTRSEESITSDFRKVAAFTYAWLEENPPQTVFLREGTLSERARFDIEMEIPIWRETWDAPLNRDDEGEPIPARFEMVKGILLVPDNATEENPATPVFFGHGLAADMALMAPMVAAMPLEEGPYVALLANWDLHGERGRGMTDFAEIAGTLNGLAFGGTMIQSASDAIVFSEVLAAMDDIPGRGDLIDSAHSFFLGQSLGGLIGVIAGTVNKRWNAAVFNVTGGSLATILRGSFVTAALGLDITIAEAIEEDPNPSLPADISVDVLLAISQLTLDFGDPVHFAAHLLEDRFPEGADHVSAVLVQESIGDGIVLNRATEALARTARLPQVKPAIEVIGGVEEALAPTEGSPGNGLTQFRTSATPFDAHLALLKEPLQEQVFTYFASFLDDDSDNDGNIVYNCSGVGGSCDFLAKE